MPPGVTFWHQFHFFEEADPPQMRWGMCTLLKPGNLSAPCKATLRHNDSSVSLQSLASFYDEPGYKTALAQSNHPPHTATHRTLPSSHINIQKPTAREWLSSPLPDTVRATVLHVVHAEKSPAYSFTGPIYRYAERKGSIYLKTSAYLNVNEDNKSVEVKAVACTNFLL